MNRIAGIIAMFSVAFGTVVPGIAEDQAPADAGSKAVVSNQFVVSLTDGTRLVCTPLAQSLPIKTSYANVDIPFEKIAAAAFDKDHKEISVRLVNGDQIKGTISVEALKVKSSIGEFTISMIHVDEITGKAEPNKEEKKYSDSPARRNSCINNLRMIDSAKEQWALANRAAEGDAVDIDGMVEYLKGSRLPKCPAGGTYKVNKIGELPECTVPGHQMPQ